MKRNLHALVLTLVLSVPALAHEGEDHGPALAPALQARNPRVAAISEEFELVGVVSGGNLVVYLDRFATNEPVAGAKLELESGAVKAVASASAAGTYTLPLGALAGPGKHALVFTVEAGNESDLLSGTLEIPGPPADQHGHIWSEWLAWSLGAAVLLLGLGWLLLRRMRGAANKR